MAKIDLRNATIVIADRGDEHITIKVGEGDLTYSEKRQIDFVKSRGQIDTARENEEVPLELSLTCIWDFITSASGEPITPEDALKHRNGAAGWSSASPDTLAPYCVNLIVTYIPPCSGVKTETLAFPQFHWLELAHSLRDGTLAVKGSCNATEAQATRT